MKYPCEADECFSIDVVAELYANHAHMLLMRDSLERALVFNEDVEDLETHKCINMFNFDPPYIPKHHFESLEKFFLLSTRFYPSIEVPPTLEMKYLPVIWIMPS